MFSENEGSLSLRECLGKKMVQKRFLKVQGTFREVLGKVGGGSGKIQRKFEVFFKKIFLKKKIKKGDSTHS